MQVLDKPLSLGAKNSTVAAFKTLVEYYKVRNKNNPILNIANDLSNQLSDAANELSNKLNNKDLRSMPKRYTAELDIDLYNQAMSLPQAKAVALKKLSDAQHFQYGIFKGGNTYSNYKETINASNMREQEGWVYINVISPDYCLFFNDNVTYIIRTQDFEPTPIVEDFTPLYNFLRTSSQRNENIIYDTLYGLSLVVTFATQIVQFIEDHINEIFDEVSDITNSIFNTIGSVQDLISEARNFYGNINAFSFGDIGVDNLKQKEIFEDLNTDEAIKKFIAYKNTIANSTFNKATTDATKTASNIKSNVSNIKNSVVSSVKGSKYRRPLQYPEQAGTSLYLSAFRDSKGIQYTTRDGNALCSLAGKEGVQAIVYTPYIGSGGTTSKYNAPDCCSNGGENILVCFQQPDQISYTAAAQYDDVQSRGAQQPFRFYQYASAMQLSFTLKFHMNDVQMMIDAGTNDNISHGNSYSLQKIADIACSFTRPFETANGSLSPKVCQVILPSITKIGYITQAQISYSGSMSGTIQYTNDSKTIVATDFDLTQKTVPSYKIADYFYDTLEISFELAIIDDIDLTFKPNMIDFNQYFPPDVDKITPTDKSNTASSTESGEIPDKIPPEQVMSIQPKNEVATYSAFTSAVDGAAKVKDTVQDTVEPVTSTINDATSKVFETTMNFTPSNFTPAG